MTPPRLCLLAIAALCVSLAGAREAQALTLRCANADVVVQSAAADDAQSVCAGAADAIEFLGARGLKTDGPIAVHIVDALPAPISPGAFGGYIRDGRRAYLLSFANIARRGTVFGLPFERALYRSLATHEVAHAVAAANFRIAEPPIEAEEYIAYAAMFATMPAAKRDPLLARFAGQAFASELQINRFVYILAPFRFGVLSYKHFMQEADGAAFLRKVLAGEALAGLAD